MAVLEERRQDFRVVGHGRIEHHSGNPLIRQLRGQNLSGVLRVAVHRRIGDRHALLFRGVGGPETVLFDDIGQIFPPDQAVEGADILDVQALQLLQSGGDLGAVLAHDVDVIAPGLVQPIPVKVHLVGEQRPVQRSKGAERVRGEEDLVRTVVGHHHLRPVDHGGHAEGQRMPPQGQGLPLFDHQGVDGGLSEKLGEHRQGLLVAHHRHIRTAGQQVPERGGVVRLHVVNDYVVQSAAVQDVVQVFKKLVGDAAVHRVKQHGLFIQQHVGVIGHASGDRVGAFKQGQAAVVAADPVQVPCNTANTVHGRLPRFI